ncbi:MAG: hypothetical protein A2508_04315 [Candidatus Lambdaproteobacteria bacterium RIFOXYD12_FULL_49_8]|uniref:Cytochrome c-552/4 domain-containing protein n=1 Tax=Candidatus Lambdaproteobacteria bacterium RIFOXYD2_FULL_50_16 TaxID=1817772 RepID=A0A1F6G9B0_9PROT|nr:MAG: hypothetical protein A2527_05655 [Candidatus Lambdaproteobacteria bacterium RIFOXYD2_FULL_50_16]OGG97400.1 MAG: hypothetical protein A2508_04315 [Candidatus Lambdaproteobacteria bacterium RIFOXYD12_FULL_49_8]
MKKKLWLLVALVLVAFFGWRFVRPMNIFVVEDRFALPMKMESPEGIDSLNASYCGSCHQAIYEEWSQSMHAKAWTDPYYQTDLEFDGNQQICLNCHIPLENQQKDLVMGFRDSERFDPILKPNPNFDVTLQQEGVTCAVCHIRDGVIIGPTGSELAPHPVKVDPEMGSGVKSCQQCHLVSNDRWDVFYKIPPCGTVAEIKKGGEQIDCVGCHLPKTQRPLVEGFAARSSGKHLFQGGHHPPTVKDSLKVELVQENNKGGKLITATLTNIKAAHALPTGTPDRHLTLRMRLVDRQGKQGPEESWKMARLIMWRPFIVDLKDTRLLYNQSRSFKFEVAQKELEQYDHVEVLVTYHLLDEARRKRIGYQNKEPIFYPIFEKTIPLQK